MKLFAREGSTLFATLTADEFAQIDGYRNSYIRGQARRTEIKVGDEIDVGAWYRAAQTLVEERERIERLRNEFADEVRRLDAQLAAIGPPELDT